MTVKEAIKKVVDLANNEVGYKATSKKKTKYAEFLDKQKDYYNGPKNGFDWCDVFVDYLFAKSFGVDIGRKMIYQPLKSLGAGVNFSANYYKNSGAWRSLPEIGSQIFFGDQHTGIVVGIEGDTIITVEGNTGGGDGKVEKKRYNKNNASISGYGIPKWTLAESIKNNEPKETIKEKIEKISNDLAKKTYEAIQGKYGNGSDRKKALGNYYTPVQWIINEVLKE